MASGPEAGLLDARAQSTKRVFDIVVALVMTVLALPVAVAIAVAIFVETGRPVFFAHTRIGRGHSRFRLWKFRSMIVEADAELAAYLDQSPEHDSEWVRTRKLKQDPRVTRVGRLLRRFSLDELPQLWNVLRGEMSMVGPRPIVEEEISDYGPAYSLYSQVLPGLTGVWQVSGRNDIGYGERSELDSEYIRGWTMRLDLMLLVKTVRAVIYGQGAY